MMFTKTLKIFSIICFLFAFTAVGIAAEATEATKKFQENVRKTLPFKNKVDFVAVEKSFLVKPKALIIKDEKGNVVWDLDSYKLFEENTKKSPDTVNPSLWRQAKLNNTYGLYKVSAYIYQVRGYDLSVMSIISSKTGYIVVDPLVSEETAKAAMDLVYRYAAKRPIKAVIYTRPQLDHFGGVKGIVSEKAIKSGEVKIIAPKGFIGAAMTKNVILANVLKRRDAYKYGNFLAKDVTGQVDAGLGKAISTGHITLIPPTDFVSKKRTKMTIDGLKFIFQYSAMPVEMNFYLPKYKALYLAESPSHSMHDLSTLSATNWYQHLSQTKKLFANDAEVIFSSHHWPTWGNSKIINLLEKQHDLYEYLHDQTLRLANQGYTMIEIAEQIKLPKSLTDEWFNHPYYGTVNDNVKTIYQRHLGWFDANPAHLHPLPDVKSSKKYIEYMGGSAAIIEKAKNDYTDGQYRWVTEVLNQLVTAEPKNAAAKNLLADAYEQLAYQSESAAWRNIYLSGAKELREGVNVSSTVTRISPDVINAMPIPQLFEFLAIHLNGSKAEGKAISLNWQFPETNEHYALILKNSVLHWQTQAVLKPDATVTSKRKVLNAIILGQLSLKKARKHGGLKIKGKSKKVIELFGLLDKFNPIFNIVTPVQKTGS